MYCSKLLKLLTVVTLERQEEVLDVKGLCILAIDCSALSESSFCIEYRDNSTTVSRWFSVRKQKGTIRFYTILPGIKPRLSTYHCIKLLCAVI